MLLGTNDAEMEAGRAHRVGLDLEQCKQPEYQPTDDDDDCRRTRHHPDSLPAGDLGFVKLVGRLAGLRRRATVEEVEDFFAPYAPYRGLAGSFILAAHYKAAVGPPLRLAA